MRLPFLPLLAQTKTSVLRLSDRPLQVDDSSGRGRIDASTRALAFLTAVGVIMATGRGLLTSNWWFFVMLSWNIFLAWFPLGVQLVIRDLIQNRVVGRVGVWLGLGLWLLFMPNAPYIITDLFHIQSLQAPLLWFDTMMIFLFALTGLLAGLYSSYLAHGLFDQLVGRGNAWGLMAACQILAGFGIYLGRWGRWNSWNLMSKPWTLGQAVWQSAHDHLAIKLTGVYGLVLLGVYVAFWLFVREDKKSV
jgi:uncharacterized membrane protein